jgi:protein tyrosine phosphatase
VLESKTSDPKGLAAEYYQVLALDKDIHHPQEAANNKQHSCFNRYFNVLPYDYNRVALKSASRGTDYINASEIRPFICSTPSSTYISTQGPLASTCQDLWQMMFENRSPVIIMLTKVQEKGLVKCHAYFPTNPGESLEFGEFKVTCMQQDTLASDVMVRRLQLVHSPTNAVHLLEHLHLYSWPDHGVPADTSGIRLLCGRLDQLRHLDRPIVVHCSAGIGRTGTFITVDVILQMLNEWRWQLPEARSLDISLNLTALVHCLRQQRVGMVQTCDQYLFCYDAILDAVVQLAEQHEEQLKRMP